MAVYDEDDGDDETSSPAGALSYLAPLSPLRDDQKVVPPYIQDQLDLGRSLTGGPRRIISGLNDATSQRKEALSSKLAAIQRATERLTALSPTGPGRVNTPLLAAASGFLAPTRTGSIGESIGAAGRAALPAIEQQRQQEAQYEDKNTQLQLLAEQAKESGSKLDYEDLVNRLNLGQKFSKAATDAEIRRQTAAMRANATEDAAKLRSGAAGQPIYRVVNGVGLVKISRGQNGVPDKNEVVFGSPDPTKDPKIRLAAMRVVQNYTKDYRFASPEEAMLYAGDLADTFIKTGTPITQETVAADFARRPQSAGGGGGGAPTSPVAGAGAVSVPPVTAPAAPPAPPPAAVPAVPAALLAPPPGPLPPPGQGGAPPLVMPGALPPVAEPVITPPPAAEAPPPAAPGPRVLTPPVRLTPYDAAAQKEGGRKDAELASVEAQAARTAADASLGTLGTIQSVRALKSPTGRLAPARQAWGSWAEALGVNFPEAIKKANTLTAFNAIAGNVVLDKQIEQKGVQTEGDAQRFRETFAQAKNPVEANDLIMRHMEGLAKRSIDRSHFMEEWWRNHDRSYLGAKAAWQDHIGQVPLAKRIGGKPVYFYEFLERARDKNKGEKLPNLDDLVVDDWQSIKDE